jgi:hypothetical protein
MGTKSQDLSLSKAGAVQKVVDTVDEEASTSTSYLGYFGSGIGSLLSSGTSLLSGAMFTKETKPK